MLTFRPKGHPVTISLNSVTYMPRSQRVRCQARGDECVENGENVVRAFGPLNNVSTSCNNVARCLFKKKSNDVVKPFFYPILVLVVYPIRPTDPIESLSNDNGDGNENVTNLHIKWVKTIALHDLHVRFSLLSISLPSSAKQRREIAKFLVL